MDLDEGAVQGYGFDLHAEDLRVWPRGKYTIQHPALRPPIQASIDGVPVAEPRGQATPLAPLLGDVHEGGEHVQSVERHVAAWRRQPRRDVTILCIGDFHGRSLA